jgi:putative tryptophan/tyrosine transport system substrate-binding protein
VLLLSAQNASSGVLEQDMKRRTFITLMGSAAVAWPVVARGRDASTLRRIGVLMNLAAGDAVGQFRITVFLKALQQLGWTDGGNVRIDVRWPGSDLELGRRHAAELIALQPDVVLASTSRLVTALQQATRTVPIVFVNAVDPVGSGIVASLARPGGNVTGFILFEYALAAKWLQLLKEIAPNVTRTAVLRDPTLASGVGQFAAIQAVGSIDTELTVIDIKGADQIGRDIASFAHVANGGLIMTANPFGSNHPDVMVAAAARHKLPAVYSEPYYVKAGGLIAYGHDVADDFQRAAGYVDRILKGEKPADLPVQAPTKYELIINLKAAKAIGLGLPASVLARADEVIE